MADEHEEKYGPGLFTQIEGTLDRLESDEPVTNAAEKEDLLGKLKYYRSELAGCTDIHPQNLEKLVEDIDVHMLQLVTGKKGGSVEEQFEAAMELEYEEEELQEADESYEETEEAEAETESEEYEYEYEYVEVDVEEELGLDSTETL